MANAEKFDYDSPDLQKAYDIHGKHYDGKQVSNKEQCWYNAYIAELLEKPAGTVPFGVALWLAYAAKYVSRTAE